MIPAGGRLAGIDGLRAVAALGVLTWHVWAHEVNAPGYGVPLGPATDLFDNSRVGVAMFFVLSGFLLYRPFAAAVIRGRRPPSLRRYFRSRALRILPAYWAVLLAVAVLFQRALLERPLQLLENMFFLQNYFPHDVPTPFHGLGIAPAWSLCVEVVFYLALPLLGLLAFGLEQWDSVGPVAATLVPVALMAVAGLLSMAAGRVMRLGQLWQMGFPTHAHWFAIGMGVGVTRVLWEDGRVRTARWWRPATVALMLGLAAVALKLYYGGLIAFDEEQSILALSCGLLLLLVVLDPGRSLLVPVLESRPLVGLGLISYSVFLWHEPLLRALRNAGLTRGGQFGFALDFLLVLALTLVASVITYRLVEKPAVARKAPRERAPLPGERQAELSTAP